MRCEGDEVRCEKGGEGRGGNGGGGGSGGGGKRRGGEGGEGCENLSSERAVKSANVHFVCKDEVLDLREQSGVGGGVSPALSQPLKLPPTCDVRIGLVPVDSLRAANKQGYFN